MTLEKDEIDSAADRTALAWSRTLLALALAVGLLGARAALLDAPAFVIVATIALAAALLVANSPLSRMVSVRARADLQRGSAAAHPGQKIVVITATVVLAVAALAILISDLNT